MHEASEGAIRRAAAELPGAIDRLVLQRYFRLMILFVTILVATGAAGAALGYWLALRG